MLACLPALGAGPAGPTFTDVRRGLDALREELPSRPERDRAAWGKFCDGLDAESFLAAHPLLSKADPEAIDSVLALFAGYFLAAADQPVKTTSPHLRRMQRWQGEVCLDWLAERQGWDQEPA